VKRNGGVRPEEFVPIQLLGRGTYGEVYLTQYKKTKKYYAIKVLSKELISKHNLVKYARTERNILSYSKHPFIVGIEFAFQNPESLFLVLEYCPGGDIAGVISIERKLSETRARTYAAEVLLGLEALHSKDFIFRDLKPGNVVLDEDGHALLTDFGLSKEALGDILNQSFCGTPAYMAPEVLNKTGHGKAVDWYHFGTFIYEILVGMPPYFAKNTYCIV
jgi:serine/threonine protein kinase